MRSYKVAVTRRARSSSVVGMVLLSLLGLAGCSTRGKTHPGLVPIVEGATSIGTITADDGVHVDKTDMYSSNRSYEDLSSEMRRSGWKQTTRQFGREFLCPVPTPSYAQVTVVVRDIEVRRLIDVCRRKRPLTDQEEEAHAEAILHPNTLPATDRIAQERTDKKGPYGTQAKALYNRILTKGKLTEDEIGALVGTVAGIDSYNRAYSALTLVAAAQRGLYPQKDLLSLLERESIKPESPKSLMFAYQNALQIAASTDQALKDAAESIAQTHKSEESLDAEERAFVTKALDAPDDRNRVLAGEILFYKHDLNPESTQWVLNAISHQIDKTGGNVRLYWQYMQRVAVAKNHTQQRVVRG